MSNPPDETFFDESLEHSRVKARIVSKYVHGWARIMTDYLRNSEPSSVRVAYLDLFSGPGSYADGTASTPILVLKSAIQDPKLTPALMTYFNDWNRNNVDSLQEEVEQLPGIKNLTFAPKISNEEATVDYVESLRIPNGIPALFFLDPFGYKAISMPLLTRSLSKWAAECIFFFNYNRVNAALDNTVMARNMIQLFGEEGLKALKDDIEKSSNALDRESIVLKHLEEALKRAGAVYVAKFAFKVEDKHRSTHHLIFATKHPKGLNLMKGIMAAESLDHYGVATMVYTQRPPNLSLFAEDRHIELAAELLTMFAGKTATFDSIFSQHSLTTDFVPANYRAAILSLEAAKKITADPPANKRPAPKGRLTMAGSTKITFQKEKK
jgi:three-Cys-motif partner protein